MKKLDITDAFGEIKPLVEIEAEVILLAVRRYATMTEAATRLKIGRSTLYRKMVGALK